MDYEHVLYDHFYILLENLEISFAIFKINGECPALTESIRGTSKEKLHQELGVEDAGVENFAFFMRSWKMKILDKSAACFLLGARFTRLEIYILLPDTKQNSFFPSTIIKCNNLDPHLRKSEFFGF